MSSPTVQLELLFLLSMIDAKENQKVMTCDIPGALMQAHIDEQLFLKFDGDLVELLIQVEPTHEPYITYVFLTKKDGFVQNEYDWCVVNRIVSGKQCTVAWYVDDIKMSHETEQVLEDLSTLLNNEFGKEAPLTIT